MVLEIAALTVLGLMCGSELNVAVFAHPAIGAQSLEVHVLVRATLAKLLGRVMPFWMAASTLLNLALLFPFEGLNPTAWHWAAVALIIQLFAVVFSLIAPVPINNRIAKWTPQSLPTNWRSEERRWDVYHALRTFGLIVAFVALAFSTALR